MYTTVIENETTAATCCVDTSSNVRDELRWFLNEETFHPEKRYFTTEILEISSKRSCSEIEFKVYRRYDQLTFTCSMVTHLTFWTSVVLDVLCK